MPETDPRLYEVSDAELDRVLRLTPADEFVVWTGGQYRNHDSLRFNAISKAIGKPGEPVTVRAIVADAARRDGTKGHRPAQVRQGIALHMVSKPTVFIWVRRGPDGMFRTLRDAPCIDQVGTNIRAGTVIDPARFLAL